MESTQSVGLSTRRCVVIFAPHQYTIQGKSVFLAGSIDRHQATWQSSITDSLAHLPITLLNPHRPDWDSTWKQDISSTQFREQVEWELNAMEIADVIAMYLGPGSPAPISLLELWLFARSGKIVVACPEGFWRRGNVQVVCKRF